MKARNPWLWVPTLYFAEGLPYFIVNTISVVILKDLGMDNSRLALLTSLIGLPWLVKPLWSPFVDIFKSKRWWIVAMQLCMAVTVAVLALTLPAHSPFTWTLVLFTITGFASASHDIAADGFYMIGLDQRRQSAFVGIRNTFYRIAMVFGQGVLVVLAGFLEKRTGSVSRAWTVTLLSTSILLALVTAYHSFVLPRPAEDAVAGRKSAREILREFGAAFGTFFTKPGIVLTMCFLLLYRLPEAFSMKLLYPFFSDAVVDGGLGLDKAAFGMVYGTAGVIALLAGGILGGWDISRRGLRRCLLPMALSLAIVRMDRRCLRGLRPVRLRLWFYSLYGVHDAIRGRAAQDLPLCHLHRFHGPVHAAAGRSGRISARGSRVCGLLRDGDGELPRHRGGHPRCPPPPPGRCVIGTGLQDRLL